MAAITSEVRATVAARARYRCEYCLSPQVVTAQTFHVDHIVPQSRGGATTLENLCYACPRCNLRKKDAVTAFDPLTGEQSPLFHPRHHRWEQQFAWSTDFLTIDGLTAIGRATVLRLQLNDDLLRNARAMWIRLKLLP